MAGDSDDYRKAGFGNAIGFGEKPALILIDPARAYLDPYAPLYVGSDDAFRACIELVKAAREAGIAIVFTRVEFMAGGADGGHFYRKVPALSLFQKGHEMAEFDPRLMPQDGDIILTKQYASAFFGTSLASTLTALGVDTCLMAGFSTSGCVRASTLDALQSGFRPMVVEQACGDRSDGVQRANLFDLGQKYADIVSLDETCAYLSGLKS